LVGRPQGDYTIPYVEPFILFYSEEHLTLGAEKSPTLKKHYCGDPFEENSRKSVGSGKNLKRQTK
jgi:hypothetical protein